METVDIADRDPAIREMLERITIIEKQLGSFTRRIDHLIRSLDLVYIGIERNRTEILNLQGDTHADLVKPDTR